MKIPKKISPCPIVEAVIEMRFDSALPGDAIFGVVYSALKDDFKGHESLPILQIPEAIRSTDKNLIYQPHYRLSTENYLFQVGPKVISLSRINEYCGWEIFNKEIQRIFQKISNIKIIEKVTRLGLRYINLFPNMNIYEKSDLSVDLKGEHLTKAINLLVNLPANKFMNTLRMVSGTNVDISGKTLKGSVIDIDTSLIEVTSDFNEKIEEIINSAHLEEKTLFFKLLTDEYIETLNPEY